MVKQITLALLLMLLLSSCIRISEAPINTPALFVTSTLPPTKPGLTLPTDTPTTPPTADPSTPEADSTPSCKDEAVLLADVTYPDNTRLKAGEKFTKTWKLQNTGTCAWTAYTAAFVSGDKLEAPDFVPVPQTDAKAIVEVSIDLVAPSNDGAFTGVFELRNAAGKVVPIGTERTFWVKIVVGNGANLVSSSGGVAATFQPVNISHCQYSENAGYVQQLIALINQARLEAKLPTLTVNAQLTAAAQAHSVDMACGNYLSHNGPNGESIGYRLAPAGYTSPGFTEIIAFGIPQTALSQWRNDQGHWEFVLHPYGGGIGVGYAYSASSNFGGYFTVDFGSP
jgi:uncharacterized protein YkwD